MSINTSVIDLGGSLVAPDGVDTVFLKGFRECIVEYLGAEESSRIIIVCGGGQLARAYQKTYRSLVDDAQSHAADWIGIAATRLNAELLRHLFGSLCLDEVVHDPTAVRQFTGRILLAAGWKPGVSTDYDAVVLAERFSAATIIDLSNIPKVYTADPKRDPRAKPIDTISWKDYRALVEDRWEPGKNVPFDSEATKRAAQNGLKVIVTDGRDLANLRNILANNRFAGTTIGPE